MNDSIFLPKIYDGIKFGENENGIEILFEGEFKDSSGFPRLNSQVAKRYGERDGQYFLAVDRHSAFSRIVYDILSKKPEYEIWCTVLKNNHQTRGKIIACLPPSKSNIEWDLGLVVIALESAL